MNNNNTTKTLKEKRDTLIRKSPQGTINAQSAKIIKYALKITKLTPTLHSKHLNNFKKSISNAHTKLKLADIHQKMRLNNRKAKNIKDHPKTRTRKR